MASLVSGAEKTELEKDGNQIISFIAFLFFFPLLIHYLVK